MKRIKTNYNLNLQELEVLKNRFLRELYNEVNYLSPENIYSILVSPIELGRILGLDINQTTRIVTDLVQENLLESTLGMGSIKLNSRSINYLTKLEIIESSKEEYEAFYVSRERYLELKESKSKYSPNYRSYLKIQVINRFTSEIFNSKILLRGGNNDSYYLITKSNGSNIGIIIDYDSKRDGLFTFDRSIYYKIESLRINSIGEYEFTLQKIKDMKEKNLKLGKISIENSPNSTIQIQHDSPNSSQENSSNKTLTNLDELASCLRKDFEVISKQLSQDNKMRLLVAVEYIEELVKEKNVKPAPKYLKKIKELLYSVPLETVTSILSEPIVKMLGI